MSDDLISREALRRSMYHEAMEKDSDEQKWDSGCWIRYKMFERVLEAQPSAEPRWIPVTERLPEEEKDVLITLDGGLVSVGYYIYCSWTEESKVEWFSDDFMVDVVAWMPLPEPWKGADDEQG